MAVRADIVNSEREAEMHTEREEGDKKRINRQPSRTMEGLSLCLIPALNGGRRQQANHQLQSSF